MKIRLTSFIAIAMLLCVVSTPAFAKRNELNNKGRSLQSRPSVSSAGTIVGLLDQYPVEFVTEAEALDLIYMYEEEKVARDVYSTLFSVWGHWVFEHIAMSEQKHMDAIAALLERYELALPENAATPRVFAVSEMQELYDSLVVQGSLSSEDALLVGATIEDLDIYDLQHLSELTDNEDIQAIYQNLMRGSRNHLRSFTYQLSLSELEYIAQYLSQNEVDEILSTERESGLSAGKNNQGTKGNSARRAGAAQVNCLFD